MSTQMCAGHAGEVGVGEIRQSPSESPAAGMEEVGNAEDAGHDSGQVYSPVQM